MWECHSLAADARPTSPPPRPMSPRPTQRALGPPPPDFYITVLLALDDVLVRREWDVSSAHPHVRVWGGRRVWVWAGAVGRREVVALPVTSLSSFEQ